MRKQNSDESMALIATPSAKVVGGVSVLFATLSERLSQEKVFLCEIGKRREESTLLVPFRLLADTWRWFCLIGSRNPRIAHVNPSFKYKSLLRDGLLVRVAQLRMKPTIAFFHGWSDSAENSRVIRYLFRIGVGRCDTILVLGSCYEKKLRRLGYERRITLMSNPISDYIAGELLDKPTAKEDSPQFVNFLFMSRVETAKGVDELLTAFQQLVSLYPNARLQIAGVGAALGMLRERVREQEIRNVEFVGFVQGESKINLLKEAHVFVLPSYSEGIPIAMLEAFAAALPVVVTSVGGIPDFFVEGQMGRMVRPREINELYDALEELVLDAEGRRRMGRYNLAYAKDNLRPKCFIDQLIRTYEQLIGRD